MSRLALGTAQFGLDYGITNKQGRVPASHVTTILEYARSVGIDCLDTAIGYGTAEQCLGNVGITSWHVVSKLPAAPEQALDLDNWVESEVRSSLRRLRCKKLCGLLLHRPRQLLGTQGDRLYRALVSARETGMVEKIGFSIYEPNDLDALWSRFPVDIVQSPFNVLDNRLLRSGWLDRLVVEGVEVHVRSIFLQGLLLQAPEQRLAKFSQFSAVWTRWDNWLRETGLTSLQACLGYAIRFETISRVVIGVDSLAQLQEIVVAAEPLHDIEPDFGTSDRRLVNPSLWESL